MYLVFTFLELSYQHFRLSPFIHINDPTRMLFILSCMLTLAMVPARITCAIAIDDVLCVYAILTRVPYFFFFCR